MLRKFKQAWHSSLSKCIEQPLYHEALLQTKQLEHENLIASCAGIKLCVPAVLCAISDWELCIVHWEEKKRKVGSLFLWDILHYKAFKS